MRRTNVLFIPALITALGAVLLPQTGWQYFKVEK